MFKRVVNLPEFNIAVFAFLLNFIWEMFQAPLFRGLKEAEYVVVLRTCLWATFGDVAIAGASFWMVAWIRSDGRDWMMNPKALGIIGFTAAGLVTTVILESVSTNIWHRWSYDQVMPVIPVLGIGLAPLLQWIFVPPLVVWFVHRQIR